MHNKTRSFQTTSVRVASVIVVFALALAFAQYDDEPTPLSDSKKPAQLSPAPIEKFSVQNADVRSVLKQLAEYSGVDIADRYPQNVEGNPVDRL
jgi:CBS-domain-containing membrane protein